MNAQSGFQGGLRQARDTAPRGETDPLQAAPFIPRHADGDADDAGFAALRREGVRLVQGLARSRWTDYNLHDPGVTMLEALCYGLTELVYRADAPLVDQLRGSAAALEPDRLGLPLPERALPCRASTADDHRAWLLDQVPGLADVSLQATPATGLLQLRLRRAPDLSGRRGHTPTPPGGRPSGTGSPAMEASDAEQARAAEALKEACRRSARLAYARVRTLGEDLEDHIVVIKERPCTLHAHLEVGGSRDPAAVLAEVYHACARYVGAAVPLVSTAGLLSAGQPVEQVFGGPAVRRRALATSGGPSRQARLYASELADIVKLVDGVRQVRDLTLDGRRSLIWYDDQGALSLNVPGPDFDPSAVRLTRRGSDIVIDPWLLRREFEDRALQPEDSGQEGAAPPEALQPTAPPAPAPPRPEPVHVSVQQHLPPIYALGEAGLPADASLSDRVRARQLTGYLSLFDQVLAHGQAQLHHLRELHDIEAWSGPSYWWQPLRNASVPGIETMYVDGEGQADPQRPEALVAELAAAFDRRAERFQRALDATLALHGHTYPQNTLRQFLGHLDAAEQESYLLGNKAAYLRWVLDHGADRAGAANLALPSFGTADNVSGLQRCAMLLLGFDGVPDPSLLEAWRRQRLQLVEGDEAASGELGRIDPAELGPPAARRAVGPPAQRQGARPLKIVRLPGPVLRAGVDRLRYHWLADEALPVTATGDAEPRDARGQLLLGPDESGHWWRLGRCRQASAPEVSDGIRRWLLELNRASEGLHVVEHVLLRARGDGAGHRAQKVEAERLRLRVSVVFPGWTARTAQQAFREFADETLQLVSPAHVAVQCLWLDAAAMADLEAALAPWLDALRAHVVAPSPAPDELDRRACQVIDQLRRHAPEAWL